MYKPDKLNADEAMIMQEYPYRGYQVLKKISFLAEAAEIVYSHREHFDGTGYPRGLKGEKIPLGARIVAIANTLDSLTSDVCYRPAQSLKHALAEIKRGAGQQFDPEIVRIFLEISETVWDDLHREVDRQSRAAHSTGGRAT